MILSFGGPDNRFNSIDTARVVILPVPYGETVTYIKGTEKGPAAILEASSNMELFDDEIGDEPAAIGIATLPFLDVNAGHPEEIVSSVKEKTTSILRKGKFPIVIGGEHSVTTGAVEAAKEEYNDLSVLYFDAHCDLRDIYSGSGYNHACVARRLIEIAPVVEAGVRSLSKEESDFIKGGGVKVINMSSIINRPEWFKDITGYLTDSVYISIDLDVFDPSIMPSVGTPEPGGILWYDFLRALRYVVKTKKIVGFDVVELCPQHGLAAPDFMAARLIYKMIGYIYFP